MNHLILSAISLLIILTPSLVGQEELPQNTQFQRAWFLELGDGKPEEALSLYEALAQDQEASVEVRARALFRAGVCALKTSQDPKAQKLFTQVVTQYAHIREVAAEAQLRLDGDTEDKIRLRRRILQMLQPLETEPSKALFLTRQLEKLGNKAAPILFEVIENGPDYALRTVTTALATQSKDDLGIFSRLVQCGSAEDVILRNTLLDQLRRIRAPLASWLTIVNHHDPAFRKLAAYQLLRHDDPASRSALQQLMNDSDPTVSAQASLSLSSLGEPVDLIAAFLRTDEPDARVLLLHHLKWRGKSAELTPDQQRALIKEISSGNDDQVAHEFIEILGSFRSTQLKSSPPPSSEYADPAFANRVVELAQTHPTFEAAVLLGESRHPQFDKVLERVLRSKYEDRHNDFLDHFPPDQIMPVAFAALREAPIELFNHLKNSLPRAEILRYSRPHLEHYSDSMTSQLIRISREANETEFFSHACEIYERLSPKTRLEVQNRISILRYKNGKSAVIAGLWERDPQIRGAALNAFKRINHQDMIPETLELIAATPWESLREDCLLNLATWDHPNVNRVVADALLGEKRSYAIQLSQAIKPGIVPFLAPRAMGVPDDVLVPVIETALQSKDQANAVLLLSNLRYDDLSELNQDTARMLGSFIVQHRLPNAAVIFQRMVTHPVFEVAELAIDRLIEYDKESAIKRLWSILDTQQESPSFLAFRSLARLLDSKGRTRLLDIIRSEDDLSLKKDFVQLLTPIQDQRVVDLIFEQTGDGWAKLSPELRKYPVDWVWAPLAARFRKSQDSNQYEAFRILMQLDSPDRLELALEQTSSQNNILRTLAISQLARFPSSDRARLRLVELLESNPQDSTTLDKAINQIQKFESQVEFLEGGRSSATSDSTAMDVLIGFLNSPTPEVRQAAAQSLGSLRDPRTLPALIRHRKDPDEKVRAAIENAMDSISGETPPAMEHQGSK